MRTELLVRQAIFSRTSQHGHVCSPRSARAGLDPPRNIAAARKPGNVCSSDNNGFFVASFPGNLDFVGIEHGNPFAVAIGGGPTTYGALTVGLAIKPPVPKAIEGLVIRPEIRYDASLNNTTPFGGGTKSSQWTFASDLIIPFTIK